jgi:hypothetical protein
MRAGSSLGWWLTAAACAPVGAGEDEGSSTSTSTSMSTATTAEPGSSTGEGGTAAPLDCAGGPDALFEQRIAPLLATDRPKTCNTCHLSGIDLEMFVQETPCRTMACLDSRGLVDLEDPASSVVLRWISRADPDSPLISQQVIDEEYSAFLSWIEATASCGLCYTGDAPCGAPVAAECAKDEPAKDDPEDPGDCSDLTREALFRHDVYAWRDRCSPCHVEGTSVDAPKWIATGPCELASLTTMRNVLAARYVNLADPAASLLLRKPLAVDAGGVEHGGGDKFHSTEETAYRDFLAWIQREADCAH